MVPGARLWELPKLNTYSSCPTENRPTVCHLVHLMFFFFPTALVWLQHPVHDLCLLYSTDCEHSFTMKTAAWENLAYWDIEESMTCNMIRRMRMVVIFTSTTGTSRHTGYGDSTCCNMPFRLEKTNSYHSFTVLVVVPINAPVRLVLLPFLREFVFWCQWERRVEGSLLCQQSQQGGILPHSDSRCTG